MRCATISGIRLSEWNGKVSLCGRFFLMPLALQIRKFITHMPEPRFPSRRDNGMLLLIQEDAMP